LKEEKKRSSLDRQGGGGKRSKNEISGGGFGQDGGTFRCFELGKGKRGRTGELNVECMGGKKRGRTLRGSP